MGACGTIVRNPSRYGCTRPMTPEHLAALDPMFAECLRVAGPLRTVFSRTGGFGGLVRIVFEQQLSTRVADTVWARFATLAVSVTPERLIELDEAELRACGLSRQKILYAKGIALAVASGDLDFEALEAMEDEEVRDTLTRLKGVGAWTADIYLMASLRRPDVWPVDDLAIRLGVQRLKGWADKPTREALIALAEPWRPYRSLAARLVWHHYVALQAAARQSKSVL
jgi:DNA-3-methyladenine glycosylase II